MGERRPSDLKDKPDSNLDKIIRVLKLTHTPEGHDAFVQYKQGVISKATLLELIAKEFVK